MGAQFESALESDGRFHQYDRQSPLVDGCGFGRSQQVARVFPVGRICNDGFETLACDPANGVVHAIAVLDVNFQVAKNAAQDAHRLLVRTQQ